MSHLEEIVKVVIYKSREIGNPVTETLAAFIAQTVLKPSSLPLLLHFSYEILFRNQPVLL